MISLNETINKFIDLNRKPVASQHDVMIISTIVALA